ncbi:MAG: hypothetical protein KKA84_12805 [Bacteroidetes bacterium]|nr:hypothetical protein [Bacteroidota bacterium]
MKRAGFLVLIVILFASWGCEVNSDANIDDNNNDNNNDPTNEVIELLTTGIWQIASDTEVGEVGAQLKYLADGTWQIRATANSDWITDNLQWSINAERTEFTMTGTNGPGTMDKIEILELSSSVCRGRIIDSTSPSAIGHITKMVKVQ